MKLILFTLFMLLVASVQAQAPKYTRFELDCKYDIRKDEMDWLKFLFKTDSCKELNERLSKVKSFNEFIPARMKRTLIPGSWVNDFPEIVGIQSQYDIEDVERILKRKVDSFFFESIDPYKQFKIRIAEYSTNSIIQDMCSDNRFHFFKTLIVDWSKLKELEKCQLNFEYMGKVNVIIIGDYLGSGKESFVDNIIGIQYMAGGPSSLLNYPNLRFAGLNVLSAGVSSLVLNQNLTHLSLNSTHDISNDVSSLSELQNLVFLGMSCLNLDSTPCKKPYLKDLSFLKDITWLKSLNLSYSGIENVDSLVELTQLERLDVSHNKIRFFPDFSKVELKYLNTENNPGHK